MRSKATASSRELLSLTAVDYEEEGVFFLRLAGPSNEQANLEFQKMPSATG